MSDRDELVVGELAPDFTLPASNGELITLSSFRGEQNVVIFFMREFI